MTPDRYRDLVDLPASSASGRVGNLKPQGVLRKK
jgi:hypothetical protein